MNLGRKTLYLITPIIIIPILMISAVAYYQLKGLNEERFGSQIDTLLDQISQHITEKISVAEANLMLLADHQLLHRYALTEDESVRYSVLLPHLLREFKNLQNEINDYYEIRYILPDGFEDVRWSGGNVIDKNEYINQDSYFEELSKSNLKVYKKLVFDENTQQYALLIVHKLILNNPAVEIYGTKPKLRGYLAITLSMEYLKNVVNEQTIGESGYLSILNNEGGIVFIPNTSHSDKSDYLTDKNKRNNIVQLSEQTKQHALNLNNTPVLLGVRKLPADLSLISILPEADLFDSAGQLAKSVFMITIGVIFFAVIFIFFILRKLILRPIKVLSDAAYSIGKGQLGIKIPIDSQDEIGRLAKIFTDMSNNLKQIHEEVSYSANHDKLTGLPNRTMFYDSVTDILSIEAKKDHKLALLFLDVDNFKQINDSLGHQAGDLLLQELALRLSGILRKKDNSSRSKKASDMVSRFGGDEFILLLNEVTGAWDASTVADRILKALEAPIVILDNQHYISCSIGITLFPEDATNTSDLIKYADIAMYHAKELGKNHYQFYSDKLNTDMQKRLQINARLRSAIDCSAFYLHYQPKIDSNTNKIVGLEALIRWNDAELGQVGPDVFIKLAEESGLITPITEWVFDEVGRQINQWTDDGVKVVPVAINVSSIQFKRRDLVKMITASLDKSAIPTKYIEVELTESSLLTDIDDAIAILNGLEQLGIKVALDDFGTGYSSLSYLNKLPLNTLKIDQFFVQQVEDMTKEYAVVDAIIALAHALDLDVIAEGVETIVQLEYLKARQCNIIQGYLFSRPVSGTEVTSMLKQVKLQASIS